MPTLEWIGKKAVLNHHRQVPFHLLKSRADLSCGDPNSGNLLVRADNLLALKALLPYYAGQVKCIYIDPPYNTGNEGWVYNDNVNSPEIKAWLGRTVGREAEDLSRHDKWLCMMYPRLSLLRQFLREDGVLLMSLDSNEHRHAELLLDEIFGAANRIETFIWKKSYGGGAKSKQVVNLHEYVLCFAVNKAKIGNIELPPGDEVKRYYKYRDEKYETRGPYRLQPLATNSMDTRPNLRYAIPFEGEEIWPEKQWQWSKERVLAALASNEIIIKKTRGRWSVNYKQYLRDLDGDERGSKLYSIIESIYTQQGTNELKAMFGDGKTFDFPKPPALIEKFIQAFTNSDSIVLDSFAGSGTTAHAVLSVNALDAGKRRFILVEMDERICREVTAERVRRVIRGYEVDKGDKKVGVVGLGGSFTYCDLGPSLFDQRGQIKPEVTFEELARHVFFSETGKPLSPAAAKTFPFLGDSDGIGVYLLYNGVLKDKSPGGGNILTIPVLQSLPRYDGPKVIYGVGCRIGAARLRQEGITFRQIPYEIRVS